MTSTVEAGRLGALKRWREHVPVKVHMGDLSPERRRIVLSLIEAERRAQEREQEARAA